MTKRNIVKAKKKPNWIFRVKPRFYVVNTEVIPIKILSTPKTLNSKLLDKGKHKIAFQPVRSCSWVHSKLLLSLFASVSHGVSITHSDDTDANAWTWRWESNPRRRFCGPSPWPLGHTTIKLAGAPGFEPRTRVSETRVLPVTPHPRVYSVCSLYHIVGKTAHG